ncbi:MAG: hypothetical protein U5N86_09580 [Planctomycetota bacterium]|nr:hypothetical protein [Planctomycetota bacterium]
MPTDRPKGKYMLMNVFEAGEIRIAICDGANLDDFFLERSEHKTQTGNVYKGRVENIVPSLQACFVNIGEQRNGFLHISDIIFPDGGYRGVLPKRKRRSQNVSKNKREMNIRDVVYRGPGTARSGHKGGRGPEGPGAHNLMSASPAAISC